MDVAFFAEMAWKSALIAGAALMLAYALRSRAAADRALVLRIGVAMLLLLPLIAVALPVLPIEAWAAPAAQAPAFYVPGPEVRLPDLASAGLQPAEPSIWDDPTPLVLLAYVGGLLMVGGRLLAGLWMLRRWTKGARDVTCPEWLDAFERTRWDAANGGKLRLMVSDAVPSPLSWGLINPVILIDPDTLAEPGEADAILAHEVAHVARGDWLALMLTRIAAALFWFNPMVWLLEREIVQQAEEAADCEAARSVEPARYAQTLLSWAQLSGRAIPANSIAPKGSALGRRVRAILDRRTRERPSGSALTRFAVMLCVAIAAPVAAMKLVQAAAPAAPEAPAAPIAARAPAAPGSPATAQAPPAPPAPVAGVPDVPEVPDVPDVAQAVDEALAEVLPQIPEIVAAAMSAVDPEAIDREIEEGLREARPHMSRAERERMRREVRRAVEQARTHSAQARADAMRAVAAARPQIARAQAEARRAVAAARPRIAIAMRDAQRAAHMGMAHGADGMARGADGMEAGARRMEEAARRLRTDAAYRERQIARARARGETVTHEQLIEAAGEMQEGAQGMREGAREMREAAERMRRGHID